VESDVILENEQGIIVPCIVLQGINDGKSTPRILECDIVVPLHLPTAHVAHKAVKDAFVPTAPAQIIQFGIGPVRSIARSNAVAKLNVMRARIYRKSIKSIIIRQATLDYVVVRRLSSFAPIRDVETKLEIR